MATKFSDLYPYVRALLGDHDAQRRMYSEDAINGHIRLRIMVDDLPDLQEDASSKEFTETLTATAKALLIFKVAKALLSPSPDLFSHRDPVMAFTRRGGVVQLMTYLDGQIEDLEGGAMLLRFDTELDAMLNDAERFLNNYTDAMGNV